MAGVEGPQPAPQVDPRFARAESKSFGFWLGFVDHGHLIVDFGQNLRFWPSQKNLRFLAGFAGMLSMPACAIG